LLLSFAITLSLVAPTVTYNAADCKGNHAVDLVCAGIFLVNILINNFGICPILI
jgi:hypothetical protein